MTCMEYLNVLTKYKSEVIVMTSIKAMVMRHPVNRKAFDVLFSTDGVDFKTLDGNDIEYFKSIGFVSNAVTVFEVQDPCIYKIMGLVLSTKLKDLSLHVSFKNERKSMRDFHKIARVLVKKESELGEDFLPENVVSLSNLPATLFMC